MELDRIRQAIEEKGFKHKWLACQIGVHPSSLSRFLTGKSVINRSALILLSQKLGIEINTEAFKEAS